MESASVRNVHTPLSFFGLSCVDRYVTRLELVDDPIQHRAEVNTPSILRYTAGSVLMGFGGILAVGCTIGAGFTGGSVLALSSLIGLASMIAGAAVTDLVLQQIENGRFAQPQLQPGE